MSRDTDSATPGLPPSGRRYTPLMISRLLPMIVSALALAPGIAFAAAPQISQSTPHQIQAGGKPHAVELEIDGSGLVPPGSTFQSVPADVLVFADDGTGWRQGAVIIPGHHGWGVGHLSISTPPVVPKLPSLRLKVSVKGVESNVFAVPVFEAPPPGPPKITSVNPWETVLGSSDYFFILKVTTNGQGGTPYFNGSPVKDYVGQLTGPAELFFQFSVPPALRTTPGSYPIQVKNSMGDSPVVHWQLVAKPVFVSISPKSLPPSAVAPGASPVSVMVLFGPSPPKTLWYSADGEGPWKKADPVIFAMSSATFALDAAALGPKSRVAIKMTNAAGETIAMLPLQVALKPVVPVIRRK